MALTKDDLQSISRCKTSDKLILINTNIALIALEIDRFKLELRKKKKRTIADIDLFLEKIEVMKKDISFLKSELKKLKTA